MARVGDFHVPNGPISGNLPKIIQDKEVSASLITPYLMEGEFYSWDGPYNTKDQALRTRPGQSLGRLYVTNLRLLFWSDDASKPQIGLFYEDIQGWKASWMPMKSRGVVTFVANRKVIFVANSTAIKNAERYIKNK